MYLIRNSVGMPLSCEVFLELLRKQRFHVIKASLKMAEKNETLGAGEISQRLRTHTTLPKDPSLVPSTLAGWLTSGVAPMSFPDLLQHPYSHAYTHMQTQSLVCNYLPGPWKSLLCMCFCSLYCDTLYCGTPLNSQILPFIF